MELSKDYNLGLPFGPTPPSTLYHMPNEGAKTENSMNLKDKASATSFQLNIKASTEKGERLERLEMSRKRWNMLKMEDEEKTTCPHFPYSLPCHIWSCGGANMLHNGLDPVAANPGCHGRESKFSFFSLEKATNMENSSCCTVAQELSCWEGSQLMFHGPF